MKTQPLSRLHVRLFDHGSLDDVSLSLGQFFSLVFPSLLSLLALRFCLVAYHSQAGACMNNVIGLLASPGLVGQTSSLIHLTSPRQRQQFQSSRIGASGQTRRLDKVLRFLVPAEKRWWD